MIEEFERVERSDQVQKLAALPRRRIETLLLERGIDPDSVAEARSAMASVGIVVVPDDVVAYAFQGQYGIGRFGDGQIPVFYAALEEDTCVAEVTYHCEPAFNELGSGEFSHDRYYNLISCNFSGTTLDLLGHEGRYIDLVSPTDAGYPFCQRLSKEARANGIDALYTRSARAVLGTCVPILQRATISNPRTVYRLRFSAREGGGVIHQRLTDQLF